MEAGGARLQETLELNNKFTTCLTVKRTPTPKSIFHLFYSLLFSVPTTWTYLCSPRGRYMDPTFLSHTNLILSHTALNRTPLSVPMWCSTCGSLTKLFIFHSLKKI